MAWQKTFLDKNRRWWLRKIARAQYYASATGKEYEGHETEGEDGEKGIQMVAKPLNMDDVTLTLWSVDERERVEEV